MPAATPIDVRAKVLLAGGTGESMNSIAKRLGISTPTVSRILSGGLPAAGRKHRAGKLTQEAVRRLHAEAGNDNYDSVKTVPHEFEPVVQKAIDREIALKTITQPEVQRRAREDMSDLIYDSVVDALNAIRLQLRATTEPKWLARQNAADIAVLMGTEIDRVIRLLAGFKPAEDEPITGEFVEEETG